MAQLSPEDIEAQTTAIRNAIASIEELRILYQQEPTAERKIFYEQTLDIALQQVEFASQGLDKNIIVPLDEYQTLEQLSERGFAQEKRERDAEQLEIPKLMVQREKEIESLGRQIYELEKDIATNQIQAPEASRLSVLTGVPELGLVGEEKKAELARLKEEKKSVEKLLEQLEVANARAFISPPDFKRFQAEKLPSRASLYNAYYDKAYRYLLESDPNLSQQDRARMAQESAEKEVYEQLVLNPSGKPSYQDRKAVAGKPDYATGTIYDPELKERRPMTTYEKFTVPFSAQVLHTENVGVPKSPYYEYPESRDPSFLEDLATTTYEEDNKSVIVESPPMQLIRGAIGFGSALTGVALDAITYSLDSNGEPIDKEDMAYQIESYFKGSPAEMSTPLLGVSSHRNWANADTTANYAMSAVAEGLSFYEAYTVSPFIGHLGELSKEKGASSYAANYLDWNIWGVAVGADLVMPLDPLKVVSVPAKGAKALSKVAQTTKYGTKLNLKNFDFVLDELSKVSTFRAVQYTVDIPASLLYKNELYRILKSDLYTTGKVSKINGYTMSSVQDSAARAASTDIASVGMMRLYGEPSTDLAKLLKPPKAYIKWAEEARRIDSPFNTSILALDQIVTDLRLLKKGIVESPKFYGAVFRDNLDEAYRIITGKKPLKNIYSTAAQNKKVVHLAMQNTFRDILKESLSNRLPINQMFVAGGTKLIAIQNFSDANVANVRTIVQKLTNPNAVVEDVFEAFVTGVGAESIRQSPELHKIGKKILKKEGLDSSETTLLHDAIEAYAWTKTITEVRTPVNMTDLAYKSAIDLRSNSVFLRRNIYNAKKYISRETYKDIRSKVLRFVTGKSPMAEFMEASYLAIKSEEIGKRAPLAIHELVDSINSMKATEFELFKANFSNYMRNTGNDFKVSITAMFNETAEVLIAAKQNAIVSRFQRSLTRYLDAGEHMLDAKPKAFKDVVHIYNGQTEFNKWLHKETGAFVGDITEESLFSIIREEERLLMITSYFDKNLFFGKKTAGYQDKLREFAAGGDSINIYQFEIWGKELIERFDLGSSVRKSNKGQIAWVDTSMAWLFQQRAAIRQTAEIEKLMIRYPTMFIDLIEKPIGKIGHISTVEKLSKQARSEVEKLIPTLDATEPVKNLLFRLNDDALTDYIVFGSRTKASGTAYKKFKDGLEVFFDEHWVAMSKKGTTMVALEKQFVALSKSIQQLTKSSLLATATDTFSMSTHVIEGLTKYLTKGEIAIGSTISNASKGPAAAGYKNLKEAITGLNKFLPKAHKIVLDDRHSLINKIMANTTGLNESYSGFVKDLGQMKALQTNAPNDAIGIIPLRMIEKQLHDAFGAYGISRNSRKFNSSEFREFYRPYIEMIDPHAVGLVMGKEMQKTVEELLSKAQSGEWKLLFAKYEQITKIADSKVSFKDSLFGIVANFKLMDFVDLLTRVQMTGILGGAYLMNVSYHGVNILSAPMILVAELGFKNTGRSLFALGAGRQYSRFITGKGNPSDVFFVTNTGRPYTFGQFQKLIDEANISTTFSSNLYQKTTARELQRHINLTNALKPQKSFLGIRLSHIDPSIRTTFTMFSHTSDMWFRRAVFIDALKRGHSAKTSAKISRESMLDYGQARTTWPDKAAAAVFGFWSFMRQSFFAYAKSLASDSSMSVLRMLKAQESYARLQDSYYVGDNRMASRLFRRITEEGREKDVVVGGMYTPQYESIALMAEAYAIAKRTRNTDIEEWDTIITDTLVAVNDRKVFLPMYQTLISYGAEVLKEDPETYSGLPAAYYPAMENPAIESAMQSFFGLEYLESEPREFAPKTHGRTYRFKTQEDKERFVAFEASMSLIAAQRLVQDSLKTYSVSNMASLQDFTTYDRGRYDAIQNNPMFGKDSLFTTGFSAMLLYQLGQARPLTVPTVESRYYEAEEEKIKQLKAD